MSRKQQAAAEVPAKEKFGLPARLRGQGQGQGRRNARRRMAGWVGAACCAALLFGGCSSLPDLDEGVAGGLQARVAAAKQLAAQEDFPAAVTELGQLAGDVAAAADRGLVSPERKARIEASLAKVTAGLEAAIAASEPPAPEPPEGGPPAVDRGKDAEDARKEAEKQREELQKQQEEAQKEADKGRERNEEDD